MAKLNEFRKFRFECHIETRGFGGPSTPQDTHSDACRPAGQREYLWSGYAPIHFIYDGENAMTPRYPFPPTLTYQKKGENHMGDW